MNRALRAIVIFVVIAVLGVALWTAATPSEKRSNQESLQDAMHSAITNPVAFAKSRFTGGIGALLTTDPATGTLLIMQIMAGSPAGKADLREGDHILQVDGIATSGRTMVQNLESIRGFSAGHVTLTVQRAGSTNFQCVIHRSSWKNLGVSK